MVTKQNKTKQTSVVDDATTNQAEVNGLTEDEFKQLQALALIKSCRKLTDKEFAAFKILAFKLMGEKENEE